MKKTKKIVKFLLQAAIGGVIGYFVAKSGVDFLPSASDMGVSKPAAVVILLASFVLGLLLTVLIHELGHLLLGIFAGLTPVIMTAGPLHWEFSAGKAWPKFSVQRGISGGYTLCIPTQNVGLKKALSLFIAGGPLASFLLLAFCILLFSPAPGWAKFLLGFTGFSTLFLGVINLYPQRLLGMYTDGARMLTIFRGGRKFEEMYAQFVLTGYLYADTKPTDWPQALIETLRGSAQFSPEWRAGQYYDYMKAKYRQDWTLAECHLNAASQDIDDLPQIMKNSYISERACFRAVTNHEFAAAAETLKRTGKGMMTQPYTAAIYKAIIKIANGELPAAEAHLQDAQTATEKAMFKGMVSLALQDIDILRAYMTAK